MEKYTRVTYPQTWKCVQILQMQKTLFPTFSACGNEAIGFRGKLKREKVLQEHFAKLVVKNLKMYYGFEK